MAKFGEVIHTSKPVLINFYNANVEIDETLHVLQQVQIVFENRV